MAAPPEVTLHNLTGKYHQNKILSDNSDAVLALQGITWMVRKFAKTFAISVHLRQYKGDDGEDHIDVIGGRSSDPEKRTIDGQARESSNPLFGKIRAAFRWVDLSEPLSSVPGTPLSADDEAYLKSGWEESGDSSKLIESFSQDDAGHWSGVMLWGFRVYEGERRYCRRAVVTDLKSKKAERINLVFDFMGKE